MDTRTGEIFSLSAEESKLIKEIDDGAGEEARRKLLALFHGKEVTITEADLPYLREMSLAPTPVQRLTKKVGRNDVCPCGSRRKFKKCCWGRVPVSNA